MVYLCNWVFVILARLPAFQVPSQAGLNIRVTEVCNTGHPSTLARRADALL